MSVLATVDGQHRRRPGTIGTGLVDLVSEPIRLPVLNRRWASRSVAESSSWAIPRRYYHNDCHSLYSFYMSNVETSVHD